MKHICFDLETLSNGPCAPIIQIGAVKFDTAGIQDSFIQNCFHTSLKDYEADYSTIMWWLQQDILAIKKLLPDVCEIKTALQNFLNWIETPSDYLYWSHATFDPPILQHALRVERLPALPHRNFRDVRTAMDVVGNYEEFQGIKHYALDDARNEAHHVISYLKKTNQC